MQLKDLPVGAKVIDPYSSYYGLPITWLILAHDHDGEGITTILSEKILALKPFDAKETNSYVSSRSSYGNSNYAVSNIRQWLNSDANVGEWYEPQHYFDAQPIDTNVVTYNPYANEAGFLNSFSEDFKNAICEVEKQTVLSPYDGGGLLITNEKMFLLSYTEVRGVTVRDISEGSKYEYFTNDAKRVAYPTSKAVENSTYKSTSVSVTSGFEWLHRSISYIASYQGYGASVVKSSGSYGYTYANSGNVGVRPACCLQSNTSVSDEPNESGVYTIVFHNEAPTITESRNIGNKSEAFSFGYSVSDIDSASVEVNVYLDDSVIDTQTFSNSYSGNVNIDDALFNPLQKGNHTIYIRATDSNGRSSESTFPFKKISKGELTEEWIEPKTNWLETDCFNIQDFNRIKNNLVYVWYYATQMFHLFDIEEMGADITEYSDYWNVDFFNAIENNLSIINENTINEDIGIKQTFYPNGVFIKASELNRIERNTLKIKRVLDGWLEARQNLPFTLGGVKGLEV